MDSCGDAPVSLCESRLRNTVTAGGRGGGKRPPRPHRPRGTATAFTLGSAERGVPACPPSARGPSGRDPQAQAHRSQAKERGARRKGSWSRDQDDVPGKCGHKQHRRTRGRRRVPLSPRGARRPARSPVVPPPPHPPVSARSLGNPGVPARTDAPARHQRAPSPPRSPLGAQCPPPPTPAAGNEEPGTYWGSGNTPSTFGSSSCY